MQMQQKNMVEPNLDQTEEVDAVEAFHQLQTWPQWPDKRGTGKCKNIMSSCQLATI
jgi:hypothetical protein